MGSGASLVREQNSGVIRLTFRNSRQERVSEKTVEALLRAGRLNHNLVGDYFLTGKD